MQSVGDVPYFLVGDVNVITKNSPAIQAHIDKGTLFDLPTSFPDITHIGSTQTIDSNHPSIAHIPKPA